MRRVATVATALALLAGCALPPPAEDPEKQRKAGYNRREIMGPRPGVFTGEDGAWTVKRRDGDSPTPEPSTTPSGAPTSTPATPPACEGDQDCEPASEEGAVRGE
jgi:hypothetical protein